MTSRPRMDVASLTAIDVHVHLAAVNEATATDTAAKKYFGDSGASRDFRASRKIAFVIFAVDERLTGRPCVTNEEVVRFASNNADIVIPIASIDAHRGPQGRREASDFCRKASSEG